MNKRQFTRIFPALLCALWAAPAFAAWPERAITLIVPFGPGSNADIFARRYAERLSKAMGQPVVIENRPGANATLGLDRVAKSAPDGYTFGLASTTNTIAAPLLQKTVPYDFRRDLTPIGGIYQIPTVLLVAGNSPYTSYAQLLAYTRANPDKMSYGYAQSTAEISGANWRQVGAVKVTGVPYKSTPQAVVDLIGGQIPVVFSELSVALPQIASGKARALAVIAPQRTPLLPNTPTFAEVQPNGLSLVGFSGLMMPAGTPREVVDRMAQVTRDILLEPDFVQFLASIGADPLVFATPAAFGDYLEKNEPVWRQLIQAAGIKAQ